jgi:hypothetical protein
VNSVFVLPLMMGTISSSLSQRTRKWRATLQTQATAAAVPAR